MSRMIRNLQRGLLGAAALAAMSCSGGEDPVSPPPPPPPPPPVAVASVELAPSPEAQVSVAHTVKLTATPKDANGQPLTGKVLSWTTSTAAVAAVDQSGMVRGVAVGQAKVTVTSEGKTAEATITVVPAPVSAIVVSPDTVSVKLAATKTFTAAFRDDLGNALEGRAVRWSSSAVNVATVDSLTGLVTAVDDGVATITATSEGVTGTGKLTVYSPVASVAVAGALDTLEAYDVRQLTATLRDAKNRILTGRKITWSSSDPAVATVDSLGRITGVDRGTVTITAESEGITGTVKRVVVIRYRSVTAGSMHACDLASGGIAWCWGLNGQQGRLGDPTLGDAAIRTTPFRVPGEHRFVQLVTYAQHTCGLTGEGEAWCWGSNAWGSLGAGLAASQSPTPVAVAGNLKFQQLAAGSDHACGLAVDGRAYCWGNNDWRQLGTGNSTVSSVPVPVAGNHVFKSLAAGVGFTCGIAVGGETYCWGANSIGQVGDGGPISYGNVFVALPQLVAGGLTFTKVSLGSQYACGMTAAGMGYCWGNNNGKFGNGAGTDASSPQAISGGLTLASIAAGAGHACGLLQDGRVYCWGNNRSGQVGAAVGAASTQPVRAGGSLLAAEVAAAGIGTGNGAHTCAISADRLTVSCWGQNDVGQLGNGTTVPATTSNITPTIVVGQKPLPVQSVR